MSQLLDGKVAMVTVAVGRIGELSARRFVENGVRVLLFDTQKEQRRSLSEEVGEVAAFAHGDVSSEEGAAQALVSAVETFGKLDIMFNNAGISGSKAGITDFSQELFASTVDMNVYSVLYGHKYAAQQYLRQGTERSIIATTSVAGLQGGWSSVTHTAAKHAALGIVSQAAFELSQSGIRANALAPGVIVTGIQAGADGTPQDRASEFTDFVVSKMGDRQPMGRFGMANDVARAALLLASDMSSYVDRSVLTVDGGATAYPQSSLATEMLSVGEEFLGR